MRWDVDGCDWQPQHQARWNAAVDRVRTTLDLVKPEPEAVGQTPNDEELDHLERQYWEETGVEEWGQQEAIFNHRAFARAVLARYGHQLAPPVEGGVPLPTNADQAALMVILGEQWLSANAPERLRRPAPAAEGEVGELVEFLRVYGDEVMDEYGDVGEHDLLTRAAELLERHPTPVPVSKRLPGPEDCAPAEADRAEQGDHD